jgi:hypothetical protein
LIARDHGKDRALEEPVAASEAGGFRRGSGAPF